MAKIVHEELWKSPGHPGMIIVTTNGFVKKDGSLTMGTGAALQATQKIPGIAMDAGRAVLEAADANFVPHYGFAPVRFPKPEEKKVGFGIFQVKEHWNRPANLDIILVACTRLREYAEYHHDWHFRLNFPGIGKGGLNPHDVRPLLDLLPDNVTVCHQGEWVEPRLPPGVGLKDVFVEVVAYLRKNQRIQAIDYLERMGFPNPEAQVDAVEVMITEWREQERASDENRAHRRQKKAEQIS